MQHLILLDAVTANGSSAWKNVFGCRNFSLQVIHTGTPTAGTVTLKGSNDGSNEGATAMLTFDIASENNKEIKTIADFPVAFISAELAGLTGGSSPTVSVKVVAVN